MAGPRGHSSVTKGLIFSLRSAIHDVRISLKVPPSSCFMVAKSCSTYRLFFPYYSIWRKKGFHLVHKLQRRSMVSSGNLGSYFQEDESCGCGGATLWTEGVSGNGFFVHLLFIEHPACVTHSSRYWTYIQTWVRLGETQSSEKTHLEANN